MQEHATTTLLLKEYIDNCFFHKNWQLFFRILINIRVWFCTKVTGHTFEVETDTFKLRNIMEAPLLKYKEEIEVRMTAKSMHCVLMNAKLARLHAFMRRSKQAS